MFFEFLVEALLRILEIIIDLSERYPGIGMPIKLWGVPYLIEDWMLLSNSFNLTNPFFIKHHTYLIKN